MTDERRGLRLLIGVFPVVATIVLLPYGFAGGDKGKKEERKGTAIGTLTAKGESFIELKADGEEKARKYVPQWVGGTPAQGGGPDKAMVKTFRDLKVGSRIEVQWVFEERLRAVAVKVLGTPKDK